MKRKLISLLIILALLPVRAVTYANSAQTAQAHLSEADIFREIFGDITEIDADEKADNLPYLDGTVLSDLREPLSLSSRTQKIYGKDNFDFENASWSTLSNPVYLQTGTVFIGSNAYTLSNTYKFLASYEGDFDNDGKKNELALLAAAKTTDNKSLLLLCTADLQTGVAAAVAVLYNSAQSTADFYADVKNFANCMAIVCADINADGYDEIVTATPTNGFTTSSSDEYGFDKFAGSYAWFLKSENRSAESWKSAAGWDSVPQSLNNSMPMWVDNCHLGAPGTTASLAEGDVDSDGYDDIVSAISTTKAQYNANYVNNMFSVYYIGGADTVSQMILKRKPLLTYADGEITQKLRLSATSGDASGFDVKIFDTDSSAAPTIFLSLKQTIHSWAAYSGEKMYTPSFYILAFDYKKSSDKFVSSTVYNGGIFHHGWVDSSEYSDTDFVYKTKVSDCAPVRIGVLKNDFGLSDQKRNYVSSGTLVADQKLISFVRYPDANTYRYDTKDQGCYTGTWGTNISTTAPGFSSANCVFYNNGINVTNIRCANISFDGKTYKDAAIISAYTQNGYNTYYLSPSGNAYTTDSGSTLLGTDQGFGVIAMPDADNDSIYLKYNKHQFFWADPVIIAALASPPYFDSLPSDMYTNSQTTYGRSTSFTTGKSESFTISAGAYVSTEIKAGALGTAGVFEAESEAMKNSSVSDENMRQVSYSQSFSASGGEDCVVLTTIAYDAYAYTACYPGENGTYGQSPYIVYVPRNGSDAIKTASLSYKDYLSFIPYAEGALPDLSDVFTHTVGKPETYPDTTPSGSHVLYNSIMTYPRSSSFPSNTGSQTMTIDISEETTQTTSAGSSVSVKLGGGIESESDDIFGMANAGTKISVGSVTEKEYESAKITTTAIGTSFEGTVFGQGDGNDASGSNEKAAFNWRLLHYIYNFKEGSSVQQFPVVTYITSAVNNPKGVVPSKVTVYPDSYTISQVGAATLNYTSTASFSVTAEGVTREAYTALEDAPLGMSLNTGGTNIGTSDPFSFGVNINGNVKPGSYTVRLNVGGVLSNPFTINVTPYEMPIWLKTDKDSLDFGTMRYNYSRGTPAAAEQTVTVSNIHTSSIQGLKAVLDDDSPFTITSQVSSSQLSPKGSSSDSATVKVAPKSGLEIGTHTDTLTITNEVTAAFVTLTYTVTNPTIPDAPSLKNNFPYLANPVKVSVSAPKDDGGAKMLYYLYTIKDHENYTDNDSQIWKEYDSTAQSGYDFDLKIPETLTIGETYTIGVKAVNTCGESAPAWFSFEVCHSEDDPDPAKNIKIYSCADSITVTWEAPDSWGENEYVQDIAWKYYQLFLTKPDRSVDYAFIEETDELQHTFKNLDNNTTYNIALYTRTTNCFNCTYLSASTSSNITSPPPPKAFSVQTEYKKAHLTWHAPEADGNSPITGYKVSKDGGASWIDAGNVLEYTFSDLTTNQVYDFAVCAVNSAGNGAASSSRQTAPHKLAAPEINSVVEGYEQLELDWYPVSDENVTGYEVSLDGGEWQTIEPISYDGTLHYIFTGLENERKYKVSVRAVDAEGGGASSSRINRTPRSIAPRPVVNPKLLPRNGGIEFYGQAYDSAYPAKYKADGDKYWFSYSEGYRLNGFENGKTYTVAISSESRDENGFYLRTVQYLTVTPDESIPDPPSEPIVSAIIGTDYIKLTWSVEDNGGSEIQSYSISLGDETNSVTLPASENSFVLKCTDEERKNYSYVYVMAVNEAGSAEGRAYLDPSCALVGESEIVVTSTTEDTVSAPYKLEAKYLIQDDDGNDVWETDDISVYAQWSLNASDSAITWNDDTRCITIGKGIKNGEYEAILTASSTHTGVTFEREIKIIVGTAANILSAQKTENGISVSLDLSPALGSVILCAAVYDDNGKLINVLTKSVFAASSQSTNTEIEIDLNGGYNAEIMMFKDFKEIQPLCKSMPLSLK